MKNTKQVIKETSQGAPKLNYRAAKKTVLCKYWHKIDEASGEIAKVCQFGERCNFVHDADTWMGPRQGPSEYGPISGPNWTGFDPGWEHAAPVGIEEPNTPMLGR